MFYVDLCGICIDVFDTIKEANQLVKNILAAKDWNPLKTNSEGKIHLNKYSKFSHLTLFLQNCNQITT